jgi:uncharacterized protein (DUF3084 family)
MEYGWIMLFILAIMGGIIAYIGDKIGSRVGKRKIVLFGLRPKYTSILVTILTGISIAAVTLGVMSVLSENVRIALFGMHQLQLQKAELEVQRDKLVKQAEDLGNEMRDKNELLASNEELLRKQEEQLDKSNQKLRVTILDLQQVQAARNDISNQLALAQVAYDQAISQKQGEIDNLESVKSELNQTNSSLKKANTALENRNQMLNAIMQNVREGQVLFRVGEVLSTSILESGLDQEKTREELSDFMSQTNTYIRQHLGIKDENAIVLYISQEEFDATVKQLTQAASGKKLIRLTAAGNIILGEPALVHVEVYANNLIYHKGDVVYSETIKHSEMAGNIELQVVRFLHNVNMQAQANGVLPDPLTGKVGALTGIEMFDTISKIKSYGDSDIVLEAVTTHDIYPAGPLSINIVASPAL